MKMQRVAWTAVILLASGVLYAAEPPPLDESLAFGRLDGKDFHEADLRHHDLSMTRFQHGDFHGVDFTGSELDRTDFDDADLSGTKGWATVDFGLGLSAMRANFQHADLSHAKICGSYFENADFRNADLHDAVLAGRFNDANFTGADVRGTVVLGAGGIESQLDDLRQRGAIVTPEDFVTAIRDGRDFSGCYLNDINLEGMNLDGVIVKNANFGGSSFIKTTFIRADLSRCGLGCRMGEAKLMEATANGASLYGADLRDADLSHANFRDAKFCSAHLNGANLTGTDLTGADFSGVDLTGANLTGAILDGVIWGDAIIADLRGVTPEQAAELKAKAARWKYDLGRKFDWFLREGSIPMWFICWPLGAICLVCGWQRVVNRPSFALLAILHFIAPLLPVLGWLLLWCWPTYLGTIILFFPGLILAIPTVLISWISWWRSSPRPSPALLALATAFTAISLFAAYGIAITTIPTE